MKTNRSVYITPLCVMGITLLVFLRTLWCDFVNLDDPYLVVNNPMIRTLDGSLLRWAFSAPKFELWMPLTWISFALDYSFWGLDPFGYHLTNLVLHSVNSALVALIALTILPYLSGTVDDLEGAVRGMGRIAWGALAAGLIFSLHPLRVESVAWVTERKDLLNGLFSLGALYAYLRFAPARTAGDIGRAGRWYAASLVLFALSLMAKSVSVVLPAMMLVLDWYPLGRLGREGARRVVLEKWPFFLLSIAISVATLYFSSKNQLMVKMDDLPIFARFLVSGNALFEYCRLMIWPVGILPFYLLSLPLPPTYYLTTFLAVLLCGYAVYSLRRAPLSASTWLCFLLPLLPVLGFIQNGDQALSPHLTYLPSVLPSIAASVAALRLHAVLADKGGIRRLLVPVLVPALLVGYSAITVRSIGVWQNTATLWTRVIETEPIPRAYADRGVYYMIKGDIAAAVADFTNGLAIAHEENRSLVYNLLAFRGTALNDLGRHTEAVNDLDAAILLKPHPTYFRERGRALERLGRIEEARRDFERAGVNPPSLDWF